MCGSLCERLARPPLGNPEKIKLTTPFRKIRNFQETECPEPFAKIFMLPPPFEVAAVLLCLCYSLVCVWLVVCGGVVLPYACRGKAILVYKTTLYNMYYVN